MFWIKLVLSAVVIATASEVSKRSSLVGGLIASLPLTTILVLSFLYVETRDSVLIGRTSLHIAWFLVPSFLLILGLPLLLRLGWPLWSAALVSTSATVAAYWAMFHLWQRWWD